MKAIKLLASAGITAVVMASTVTGAVFAWHPKGTIVKYVQNETAQSGLEDANDEASAVAAKPGDILKYVIKVSNEGDASSNENSMVNTVLTDTLPTGVELVSQPSQRTISVNLGTIEPGKSVTKSYEVKVTSETDGDVLTNKACFTGNSEANDNEQKGCDTAVVKVKIPETPPKPTPTPTPPAAPTKPQAPETLPNTGAGSFILPAAVVSILGYAGYLLRLKKQRA
jgi:uncharacterized repeat protein (TIGR01451 family)/LPXTG-motif cell wall-anchored protein